LVPPDQFIPLAEDIGMIVPIGEWVLRQACATAAADWPKDVRVAVNISSVQFRGSDIVGVVRSALRDSGLEASRLELEITETAMLQDAVAALSTIHQLRDLNVQISMDDFGTGYSSLSYLRRFPFDRIKIDQSFVRDMDRQDDSIAIVRTMITLGRNLGMGITAEGVETRRQLDILEDAGCTEVQGYLFSRPVTASAVADLLRSGSIIANGWPLFMQSLSSAPTEKVPAFIRN
jgi:EAL domain-containing protein (putative c-di-GMP-specific phosphodiesterase class I)